MALGREFAIDEDRRAAPIVVVLAHRTWQSEFNTDPAVVGRAITVGGNPQRSSVWRRARFGASSLPKPRTCTCPCTRPASSGDGMVNWFAEPSTAYSPTAWVRIVGRLHEGASPEQAAQQLSAEARQSVFLTNVATAALPDAARPDMERFVALLGGAVGLLLIVGALSVGMLLLVRTEGRSDEFAVCLAMGASRIRLAGGIALEGLSLALSGAALALPFAALLHAAVRTFNLPVGSVSICSTGRSMCRFSLLRWWPVSRQERRSNRCGCLQLSGPSGRRTSGARWLDAKTSSPTHAHGARHCSDGGCCRARRRRRTLCAEPRRGTERQPGYDTTQLITEALIQVAVRHVASGGAHMASRRPAATAVDTSVTFTDSERIGAGGSLRIDGVRRAVPFMTEFRIVDDRVFHHRRVASPARP